MSLAIAVTVVTVVGVSGAVLLVFLAQAINFEDEGFAAKDEILKILPGINCGACGYPSCVAYAEAVANGKPVNLCRPGREKVQKQIELILEGHKG